jgi:hypothetical protein
LRKEAMMRMLKVLALLMFVLVAPAVTAEETLAPELEWQNVITAQIEAFRMHDSPGALNFAAQSFKEAFPDPSLFYDSIYNAGYGPILESRSHSFGEFQLAGDEGVLQIVKIVGPDQQLYNALYQLGKEPDGWRVQGVQLSAQEGIGI